MKLLTKKDLKSLPPIDTNEHVPFNEQKIVVKLFCPWSDWTWYLTEYDPETGMFFGYVEGFESEWGYANILELAEIRGIGGLKIERDRWFEPCLFKNLEKRK